MHLIVVRATWDPEAKVFVAESSDVPGLATEAPTLEALRAKLPGMIQDLLDDDGHVDRGVEVPIEIIAQASTRVRLPA